MPKALLAIPSYFGPFYDDGAKTGLFFSEAYHPWEVFTTKGYEVDIVSETGTYGIDEHSVGEDFLPAGDDRKVYENKNSGFMKALKHVKKASDVKAKDYEFGFAAAGHAALYYPKDDTLRKLFIDIYDDEKIIAAVCHGAALFDKLVDPKSGKVLLEGRKITGFTEIGEIEIEVDDAMKRYGLPSIEETTKSNGGEYVSPAGPWDDFCINDGRIYTGANPQSAKTLAKNVVEGAK